MAPNSEKFRLRFSRADDNFCGRILEEHSNVDMKVNQTQKTDKKCTRKKKGTDSICDLSLLPVEILFQITDWLDSISLRNLSLTCKRIREICFSLVTYRGCVAPVWERQRARGQRRERKVWEVVRNKRFFSSAMAPVHTWVSVNGAEIQKHLGHCCFNHQNIPQRPPVNKQFKSELEARILLKRRSDWYIE